MWEQVGERQEHSVLRDSRRQDVVPVLVSGTDWNAESEAGGGRRRRRMHGVLEQGHSPTRGPGGTTGSEPVYHNVCVSQGIY